MKACENTIGAICGIAETNSFWRALDPSAAGRYMALDGAAISVIIVNERQGKPARPFKQVRSGASIYRYGKTLTARPKISAGIALSRGRTSSSDHGHFFVEIVMPIDIK